MAKRFERRRDVLVDVGAGRPDEDFGDLLGDAVEEFPPSRIGRDEVDRGEPVTQAVVRGRRVERVQDAQFQHLPRPDVVDDLHTHVAERRHRRRPSTLDDPLRVGLGAYRPGVVHADRGVDGLTEVVVGRRHHPVDHAVRERQVFADPFGERRIADRRQFGHDGTQRRAVALTGCRGSTR